MWMQIFNLTNTILRRGNENKECKEFSEILNRYSRSLMMKEFKAILKSGHFYDYKNLENENIWLSFC